MKCRGESRGISVSGELPGARLRNEIDFALGLNRKIISGEGETIMYCPQCGTESPADLKYCRSCGANLKVIGKAVSLSDAIARSDHLPGKIKEMMKSMKVDHLTNEI